MKAIIALIFGFIWFVILIVGVGAEPSDIDENTPDKIGVLGWIFTAFLLASPIIIWWLTRDDETA
jgi:hypothetical protein